MTEYMIRGMGRIIGPFDYNEALFQAKLASQRYAPRYFEVVPLHGATDSYTCAKGSFDPVRKKLRDSY